MIIEGDSLEKLKDLAEESVDLLATDPPYGYSFMGKSWDKTLPDIGIFKECLRVLKPGAFAFVMSAPRSDVCARMMLMLEDAGFEIGFTPIYWTYASGFPKAMNIGKMVDKRIGAERVTLRTIKKKKPGASFDDDNYEWADEVSITAPATPEAKALDGSYGGFQPKPAVEVVIVAMKPLSEKTFVDQALKNGKGITWLDDCRVPTTSDTRRNARGGDNGLDGTQTFKIRERRAEEQIDHGGRFPANLLVSDDVLNDGRITKSTIDRNPIERGTSKSWFTGEHVERVQRGDSGSYSRYFDLDAWAQTLPFLAVPKASKSEKNAGLDAFEARQATGGGGGIGDYLDDVNSASGKYGSEKAPAKNFHPTVKPLKLMSYLITLGSRPGDVVLDPFLGSGTTAVAAKQLGRECIGIEREKEYCDIARARLDAINPTLI